MRGIALFNEARYFDAHEAWEPLWLASTGIEKEFLHGLIQIAAALHHLHQGNAIGAASVYGRAKARLAAVPSFYAQVNVARLLASVDSLFPAPSQDSPRPIIHLEDWK